jgi:uncharacterized protein (TIGR03086 family)
VPADPIELLERTLRRSQAVVDAIAPTQADLRTPCPDWTVRDLVGHLLVDLTNFRLRAEGGEPDWTRGPMDPGTNWSDAFRAGADALAEAWRTHPPDPDGPVAGQTIAEFAIHTWDLARATGQSHGIDNAAADFATTWMGKALQPEYRGSAFGAEHAVPADAPSWQRLVAFAGRDPWWTTPT